MIININDNYKNLIDALSKEEFELLKKSILAEGCRDAICVLEDGTIIDGHNRFKICSEHDIKFDVKVIDIKPEDVEEWVYLNQLGKRNLNEARKAYYIGKYYEANKQKWGGNNKKQGAESAPCLNKQKWGGNNKKQEPDSGSCLKSLESIAEELNIPKTTIKKNEQYSKGIDAISEVEPELKQDILNDKKPITKQDVIDISSKVKKSNKVIEEELKDKVTEEQIRIKVKEEADKLVKEELARIKEEQERKKELKKELRRKHIEELSNKIRIEEERNKNKTLEDKTYDIIAIDPPWDYEEVGGRGECYDPDNSRVASPYPSMKLEDIKNIDLPLKENAVVYLWTTAKFLKYGFDILDSWGLKYINTIVWDKVIIGMGNKFRNQCEYVLVAERGNTKDLYTDHKDIRDIITAKRRKHSQKPNEFFELVNKRHIGTKLEYFSRTEREGWDTFGIERDTIKG